MLFEEDGDDEFINGPDVCRRQDKGGSMYEPVGKRRGKFTCGSSVWETSIKIK
jgi:hypothetical protein